MELKMMKLKIWVAFKHDDGTVIDIPVRSVMHAKKVLHDWHVDGGFWHSESFFPYHRINYVEIIEDES
jgi:hypothetical protein